MYFATDPHVILINNEDKIMGLCEKIHAHQIGVLHRAVSLFAIYKDTVLIQQRSQHKYHGQGLWSNTVCTQPILYELNEKAIWRAIKTELGLDPVPLCYIGKIIYHTSVGTFIEHELDHIFIASIFPKDMQPSIQKVQEIQWIHKKELLYQLKNNPSQFTPWFPLVY